MTFHQKTLKLKVSSSTNLFKHITRMQVQSYDCRLQELMRNIFNSLYFWFLDVIAVAKFKSSILSHKTGLNDLLKSAFPKQKEHSSDLALFNLHCHSPDNN